MIHQAFEEHLFAHLSINIVSLCIACFKTLGLVILPGN